MAYAILTLVLLNASPALSGNVPDSGGGGSAAITADELRDHVRFLASDSLEGRKSGSVGNTIAAGYIAEHFKEYGLLPGGEHGTFFQEFEFTADVRIGPANSLRIARAGGPADVNAAAGVDFSPLGFSTSDSASGSVIFCGYGISSKDAGYDDYAGIDATGKVVIALRYSPEGDNPHGKFWSASSLRSKARVARDHGARALVIVEGPNDVPEERLIALSHADGFSSSGIPVVSCRRSIIGALIEQRTGLSIKKLQDSISSSGLPLSFDIPGATIALHTDLEHIKQTSSNVIGYLPQKSEDSSGQFLIIGAHYDHLGFGGPGSGSLKPDAHEIHNGADDNASGTAALLELAQKFASRPAFARTLVFIAFSGEEMGLLGSAHYVESPTVPLSHVGAMLNMDMVGRLRNDELIVQGTATSPRWPGLLDSLNSDEPKLTVKSVPDGFGPSDHSSFYGKDIPVLFFFTGSHEDYHKPSDDWQLLNYTGEQRVAEYVARIVTVLASSPDPPVFSRAPVSNRPGEGDSRGFRVTLGVIPDYGETQEGMKINGLRTAGPAEKAGMKPGDVIVKMAGKQVMNVYDYMGVLGELKAGEEVELEVKRDGEVVHLKAVMQARQ